VYKRQIIGRYGGEEFCLLLPLTTSEQARQIADNICTATRSVEMPAEGTVGEAANTLTLSVSIGIASTIADGKRMHDLVMAADRRVYVAKAAGRDRYIDAQLAAAADFDASGGPDTGERRRRAVAATGVATAMKD